jgi:hypothetical protein
MAPVMSSANRVITARAPAIIHADLVPVMAGPATVMALGLAVVMHPVAVIILAPVHAQVLIGADHVPAILAVGLAAADTEVVQAVTVAQVAQVEEATVDLVAVAVVAVGDK